MVSHSSNTIPQFAFRPSDSLVSRGRSKAWRETRLSETHLKFLPRRTENSSVMVVMMVVKIVNCVPRPNVSNMAKNKRDHTGERGNLATASG